MIGLVNREGMDQSDRIKNGTGVCVKEEAGRVDQKKLVTRVTVNKESVWEREREMGEEMRGKIKEREKVERWEGVGLFFGQFLKKNWWK